MFRPKLNGEIQDFQCPYKHSKQVSWVNMGIDIPSTDRFYCDDCRSLIVNSIQPFNFVKQMIEDSLSKKLQQFEQIITPHIIMLRQFIKNVDQIKQEISMQLDGVIKNIQNWINDMLDKGHELSKYNFHILLNNYDPIQKEINDDNFKIQINEVSKNWYNKATNVLSNCCDQIKIKLNNIINPSTMDQSTQSSYAISINHDQSLLIISDNSKIIINQLVIIQQKRTLDLVFISFNPQKYQIQKSLSSNYPFQQFCQQNLDKIYIYYTSYQQQQSQINYYQIGLLEGYHKKYITILKFFNQIPQLFNHFVSGSDDNSIIVWSPVTLDVQQKMQWRPQYLQGHSQCIRCLITHPNEKIIVSGSNDTTIRFWIHQSQEESNQNQWICNENNIIHEHQSQVFTLAINQDGKKMISCGEDMLILVIKIIDQAQWSIVQRIQLESRGYRLCFITDNIFAFQPYQGDNSTLHIYKFDHSTQLFNMFKKIPVEGSKEQCSGLFPSIYIANKNLLICKNGFRVNILRFNFNINSQNQDDFEAILVDSINFNTYKVFGTVDVKGELLLTWDANLKRLQIRKLN